MKQFVIFIVLCALGPVGILKALFYGYIAFGIIFHDITSSDLISLSYIAGFSLSIKVFCVVMDHIHGRKRLI